MCPLQPVHNLKFASSCIRFVGNIDHAFAWHLIFESEPYSIIRDIGDGQGNCDMYWTPEISTTNHGFLLLRARL